MSNGINVLNLCDGISCGKVALDRAGIKVNKYFSSEIDENAIAISKKNHDGIIRLGDITKWREWDLPHIDLVLSGTPCFPAGALVLREDGFVPIEEIKVGDMVMTHKGRLRRVLATGSKLSETIMLKGQGSVGIECTPNHPFYSVHKQWPHTAGNPSNKSIVSEPEWVEAKDMKSKFWLNVCNVEEPTEVPQFDEAQFNVSDCGHIKDFQMTSAFFYFVGRWLGDGWANVHKRKNRVHSNLKRVYVCCSHEEEEYLEKKLSETGLYFSRTDNGSTMRFTCSSTQLYDWIVGNFGVHAGGKNIPYWCLGMPVEFRKAMFEGYIDADGTNRDNGVRSNSINRGLTVGMKLIAGSLGMASSTYKLNTKENGMIEGRIVNQKPLYEQSYYHDSRSAMFLDTGWFGCVRSVEPCRDTAMVYNLEVEEDNSYTVDGIAVHNCQGFSRAGMMLNFKDERSKLFFEFVDILNDIKTKNPDVLFLFENVKMKDVWKDIITDKLGVEPIEINSKLMSAQNRWRTYWTNIPNVEKPKDKGIKLLDILEDNPDVELVEHKGIMFDSYFPENAVAIVNRVDGELRINQATKKGYIVAHNGDGVNLSFPTSKTRRGRVIKQKSSTLDCACDASVYYDNTIRRLTCTELERLQTLPDGYTDGWVRSNRVKAIGNGWTVDVIAWILSFMKQ